MPFFKLPYTTQQGSARAAPATEDILHFNSVRIRVNGTGSLKLKLWSLDNARSQSLKDVVMSEDSGRQPTVLANFIEQRASLEVRTVNINEYFRVNRVIIYSRFFAAEFPQ